jgi:hypothetical protein
VRRWPVLLALLLLVACQRKAPGPQECRRFALVALGIAPNAERVSPQVFAAVDELTRRCITTPFDRALLRCVDQGRQPRLCLAEYQRRVAPNERTENP